MNSTIGGSSLSMAYGLPIKKKGDPHINLAERALMSLNEALVPSNFLVNIIPALCFLPDFFPGSGFKKQAKMWKAYQEDLHNLPFERALREIVRIPRQC